jgi:hypothetical protein
MFRPNFWLTQQLNQLVKGKQHPLFYLLSIIVDLSIFIYWKPVLSAPEKLTKNKSGAITEISE